MRERSTMRMPSRGRAMGVIIVEREGRCYTAAMRHHIAAILSATLALAGCTLVSIDLQQRFHPLVEETVEGSGTAKVLLLDLSGVLSEETVSFSIGAPPPRVPLLARVQEELRKAEEDSRIKALIVRINSPGGTITASDILYREIHEFKVRRKIPVIAAIMDVGASGGYYAALAAATIFAHPTTVTGSIGVVMLTVNAQGLMEKIGVAPLAIKSGAMKDAGSPFRALNPEDRVAYLDEVVEMAKKAAGVDEARVVMYHRPKEYRASIYSGTSVAPASAETALAHLAGMLGGAGPRFMYLWWP